MSNIILIAISKSILRQFSKVFTENSKQLSLLVGFAGHRFTPTILLIMAPPLVMVISPEFRHSARRQANKLNILLNIIFN
ncbi:hypothetical protein [uncultured Microbulbifer sp.]|uniref:hypothetical protein n=1 Tax=uncultured Microbulbifer sp. TaxID=348147 RepID=UPI002633C517|nr:hypothetical protein [uncultured Microbulbifer sp.]